VIQQVGAGGGGTWSLSAGLSLALLALQGVLVLVLDFEERRGVRESAGEIHYLMSAGL